MPSAAAPSVLPETWPTRQQGVAPTTSCPADLPHVLQPIPTLASDTCGRRAGRARRAVGARDPARLRNPKLATKELGGTGRRHDWAISARILERLDVPFFLAGGLNSENETEALTTVRPFGLTSAPGCGTRRSTSIRTSSRASSTQ